MQINQTHQFGATSRVWPLRAFTGAACFSLQANIETNSVTPATAQLDFYVISLTRWTNWVYSGQQTGQSFQTDDSFTAIVKVCHSSAASRPQCSMFAGPTNKAYKICSPAYQIYAYLPSRTASFCTIKRLLVCMSSQTTQANSLALHKQTCAAVPWNCLQHRRMYLWHTPGTMSMQKCLT